MAENIDFNNKEIIEKMTRKDMVLSPVLEFKEGVYFKGYIFELYRMKGKKPSNEDTNMGVFYNDQIMTAKNNLESEFTEDFNGEPVRCKTESTFQSNRNKEYVFPDSIKTKNLLIKFGENVVYSCEDGVFWDVDDFNIIDMKNFNLDDVLHVYNKDGSLIK